MSIKSWPSHNLIQVKPSPVETIRFYITVPVQSWLFWSLNDVISLIKALLITELFKQVFRHIRNHFPQVKRQFFTTAQENTIYYLPDRTFILKKPDLLHQLSTGAGKAWDRQSSHILQGNPAWLKAGQEALPCQKLMFCILKAKELWKLKPTKVPEWFSYSWQCW